MLILLLTNILNQHFDAWSCFYLFLRHKEKKEREWSAGQQEWVVLLVKTSCSLIAGATPFHQYIIF